MLSEKEGGPPRPSDDAPEEEWREYMSYHYTKEETTESGFPVLTRPPGEMLVPLVFCAVIVYTFGRLHGWKYETVSVFQFIFISTVHCYGAPQQ